eukprot:m.94920 g.94920  ORF g.94920 m.94920 type:complete len:249 (+) comp13467_c0_seq1:45-791(+)
MNHKAFDITSYHKLSTMNVIKEILFEDNKPRQDKAATGGVQLVAAIVLGLMAASFPPLCLSQIIFACESLLRLCLYLSLSMGDSKSALIYFDPSLPTLCRLVVVALTAQHIARWAMVQAVWDPKGFGMTALTIVFVGSILPYLAMVVFRSPLQMKRRVLTGYSFFSTMGLAIALIADWFYRPNVFRHHKHDHRILFAGLSQCGIALLLFPGYRKLPAWTLEVLNLSAWVFWWLSSGHKKLLLDIPQQN